MRKKLIIIVSICLGIFIFGIGIYAYGVYHSAKQTAHKIYKPLKSDPKIQTTMAVKNEVAKPISILLMGVDQRTYDKGRSDTLIVMTLNPQTHTTQMISIPRDTRALLGHTGTIDKINAAYFYGGPDLTVQTVEQFLNIHLDYYVRINMQGLVDLVNAVGGVTVNNDLSWKYFPKGELKLNGKKALAYVRMRHEDPRGDFGRNMRQREVIKSIIDKGASINGAAKYQKILDAIQANVTTNISFDEMKYIAQHYVSAKDRITNYEVKGHGEIINKLWYLVVSDAERKKVSDMIKSQLQDNRYNQESTNQQAQNTSS